MNRPFLDVRDLVVHFPTDDGLVRAVDGLSFTLDKGRTLDNSDRAGPASRQAGRLIVVEGYMDVFALDRATYRIEADSTGLRESSAVGWKVTPWTALRGAVDESVYHYSGGSLNGRTSPKLDHISRRVYFTDDQGEEIVSIGDDLDTQQGKALLEHVLARTRLRPGKRERGKR